MVIRTRLRSRRRGLTAASSGHFLFGGTGWLFADLLLAIALVFLVATTVGTTPPKPPHKHVVAATPSPTPSPKKTGQPEPALDLNYVTINLTINPSAVMSGNSGAIAAIRKSVAANPQLRGRLAGLVLLFAGDDNGSYPQWQKLDRQMWQVIQGGGADQPVFKVAVTRNFLTHGGASTAFQLDVYLFKTT